MLKPIAYLIALLSLLASSVLAQSYSDVTKWNGTFGHRAATLTSSSTGGFDNVPDTRANLSVVASATTANISGTLTLAAKDGTIVSQSNITLNQTTPTVVTINGPLNFQKVQVKVGAPGAATAKSGLIYTKQ